MLVLPLDCPRLHLFLHYQIPENKERTYTSCSIEHHLCCAPSFASLLQLFVTSANVLCCAEGVLYELINHDRLCVEMRSKRRLQFCNLQYRFLSGPALC